MSMSEREVLEQLEREFAIPDAPARAVARWSRTSPTTPAVLAAVILVVGLSLVLLGLVLGNVAGVALASLAYVLIVGSAGVLYRAAGRARAALLRRTLS